MAVWRVEKGVSKFPYRITIEQSGKALLCVRAKDSWPGPGASVFCLRDNGEHSEGLEEVERVPIIEVSRIGAKIAVILDRPQRKRCEFLVLTKGYASKSGSYEQIFFRTESSVRAHKSRGAVEIRVPEAPSVEVVIDSNERYPWSFKTTKAQRRRLPVGDYALVRKEEVLAVVERKTFPNLLADIGAIKAMHQQWSELSSYPVAAVVIEANYGDVVDRFKTAPWPPGHAARVMAELAALHPKLNIVWAGNRKLANQWCLRFFLAAAGAARQHKPDTVAQVEMNFKPIRHGGGLDQRIRSAVRHEMPDEFETSAVVERMPDADRGRVYRILCKLREEGQIERVGFGKGARWRRVIHS